MPGDVASFRETLTRQQVVCLAAFAVALVAAVGFGGVFLLAIRALVIGPFVLHRVRYRPLNEAADAPTLTADSNTKTEDARQITQDQQQYIRAMGKGVVPNAAALILFEVVFSSRFTYDVRQLLYRAVGATALEFAWLPVSVLLTIVTVREITDARVNDWRHPRTAWSSLFTSAERARPWLLPLFSILVAKILRIAIITGSAHVWDQLTTAMSAALDHWQQEPEREDQLRAAVEIILEGAPYVLPIIPVRLLAVALICPLEVAMTRLAAQRSAESSSSNLNSDAESGVKPDDLGSETDQAVEPACRLTDTRYTGLVDCLWKIRKEEGWLQLYRGWWATLLFTAHGLTWEWILTFTYW